MPVSDTALGQTLRRLLLALRGSATPHVFVGDLALRLHGLPLEPQRLQVCLPPRRIALFCAEVRDREFRVLPPRSPGLVDPLTEVVTDLLATGDPAGDRFRFPELRLPGEQDAALVEGTPVPTLPHMLALLLATGREADVNAARALCMVHGLGADFERELHPAIRGLYHGIRG